MSKQQPKTALLVLDMFSEFSFPEGHAVMRAASTASKPLAKLLARARKRGIPIIYVNDTRGVWESDQRDFIDRCLAGPGAQIADRLRPAEGDYFMFKPKHSAFYGTPLAELLYMLKVQHVILSGISSHQCVLVSASDAHVRGLLVTVVEDCIAASQREATTHALYVMKHGMQARVHRSTQIRF